MLNGNGAPADATGVDGDFYIDTAANEIYGPKAGGVWPAAGVPLVGPAGADGAVGPQGPAGAGVPAGGTAGQVLSKIDGADHNMQWINPSGGGALYLMAHTVWDNAPTGSSSFSPVGNFNLLSTYERYTQFEMPIACTLGNLRVRAYAPTAFPAGTTVKLRRNLTNTTVTCALDATTGLCTDTANTVSLAAGDLINYRINTTITDSSSISVTAVCQ